MRKLRRNVNGIGFVSLLNDTSSEMIYPLLPLFLVKELKAGPTQLGLIEGFSESISSILKLFSGYLSDRVGKRKPFIFLGYFVAIFSRPIIGITTRWWQLLGLRIVDRFGKGIRTSARDALISQSTPHKILGRAFGFQRALDHSGAILGPILAFSLFYFLRVEIRNLFILSIVPGIFAFFLLFLVREKEKIREHEKKTLSLRGLDGNFIRYLATLLVFTLSNSSDTFLLLKGVEVGIRREIFPLLWVFLHIIKSLTSTPSGSLSDRIGRKKMIFFGWLLYAFTYFLFGVSSKIWQFFLLFALYGFYFGLTEGVERAFVSQIKGRVDEGTAFGLYHFVIGIAIFPASLLFGIVWKYFGSFYAFLLSSLISFISSLSLLLLVREKVSPAS